MFVAVLDAANPEEDEEGNENSLLWRMREGLFTNAGIDQDEFTLSQKAAFIYDQLTLARHPYGIGLPPFRKDMVDLLGEAGDARGFADVLDKISPTARVRNGLYYFVTFAALARAAGMVGVLVFLDQLEDLANPRLSTKAKRHREVERFRDDVFEDPFLADTVSYCFHVPPSR